MKALLNRFLWIFALIIALIQSLPSLAQTDTLAEEQEVLFENKQMKVTMVKKKLPGDSISTEEERRIVVENEDGSREEIVLRKKSTEGETSWTILDEDFDEKDEIDEPKTFRVELMSFDIGLNNWLNDNGSFDMQNPYEDMRASNIRSINFGWNIVNAGLNISREKVWLMTGVGIEYNNYRFDRDIDLSRNTDFLEITTSETNYLKNKLVSQYLSVPLGLHFKSNPDDEDESFDIEAGVQFGYLIGSHQKQKWDDGDRQKRKLRGDYHFSDTRMGYYARLGFGGFDIYAKYYPGASFKVGQGPQSSTVCAGITLNAF